MAIVMSVLSLAIYEILAKQIKCQKCDLENEVQGREVEKLDLSHFAENIRFYISELFLQFYLLGNMFTQTWTHIPTRTLPHIAGDVVIANGEVCNALEICLKP